MKSIDVDGRVDELHRLTADVPVTVRPGSVRVRIVLPDDENDGEDEAGAGWARAVAAAWADEWADPREDIYTVEHGQPVELIEGRGHAAG